MHKRMKYDESEKALSDQILDYIRKCDYQFLNTLTVKKVSEVFEVSDSFIARKFKQEKTFSLGQFICCERMRRAALLLLAKEDLKVKTLSELFGFCDCNYFIRVFRKYYGISPNHYRAIVKEKFRRAQMDGVDEEDENRRDGSSQCGERHGQPNDLVYILGQKKEDEEKIDH